MSIVRSYADKDSFIMSDRPYYNFGGTQVLELSLSASSSSMQNFTRALIQFDISSLTANATGVYSSLLTLYNCRNNDFTDENFDIYLYPLTEAWNEGNGSAIYPLTGAVNYVQRTSIANWSVSGGTYTASPSAVCSFIKGTENLTANVSAFIEYWKTNPNNGIIMKYSQNYESITADYETMKTFYGANTHTYFKPFIDVITPNVLLKDDRHNLHYGNNVIFIYDTNVSTTAYPGFVYVKPDLSLSSSTAHTANYFSPYTWYINFNSTRIDYPELYTIQSNTAQSYSLTSSVTGFLLQTSNELNTSEPYCNALVNETYYTSDVANIRIPIFTYTHRGAGSVVMPYYPSSAFIYFVESVTKTPALPIQEMNYNKDGHYISQNMNVFVPNFFYIPVVKFIDKKGNYVTKMIENAKFYVRESIAT